MPEINVFQLRRTLQADYAQQGERLSSKQADRLLAEAFNDATFKQWLAQIDEYDFERGLTDIGGHSDTTGRQAIMRVLRAQHKQETAA